MKFSYQKADSEYYPVITLSLIYKGAKLVIDALVDSGANISVFGASVAESLSLNIESGRRTFLGGVGGRILGYEHALDMEIADKRFKAKVIFSREFLVSFNLIGRKDVFDEFTICFNEKKKRVELESFPRNG